MKLCCNTDKLTLLPFVFVCWITAACLVWWQSIRLPSETKKTSLRNQTHTQTDRQTWWQTDRREEGWDYLVVGILHTWTTLSSYLRFVKWFPSFAPFASPQLGACRGIPDPQARPSLRLRAQPHHRAASRLVYFVSRDAPKWLLFACWSVCVYVSVCASAVCLLSPYAPRD